MIGVESAFLTDVATRVAGDNGEQPMRTLNEAWCRLGIAVLHYEETINRPAEMRRNELAREALANVAATAWLAALHLGLDSRGDAIGKDIPF